MSSHGEEAAQGHWGPPYLLYLVGAADDLAIKTARGLAHWRPEWCIGQYRRPDTRVTLGLPDMEPAMARASGANTMVIGTANAGGVMAREPIADIIAALDTGLNVVSGLHEKLRENADIVAAAARNGRVLFDAREYTRRIPVGNGRKRSGRRLLTVGTDCSVGKMYTALAIERSMRKRGLAADFRATGQTGIFIAGSGICVDAVIADFISGAAELLSPAREDGGWDLIEGQGSLFHPSYAGVSLGLLHGSQPDVFVVCHEPGREFVLGHEEFALPSIEETIDMTLRLGRRTNPAIRCAGVSLNTGAMDAVAAGELFARESARLGMPVADPMRGGAEFERLVDACLAT